MVIQSVCTFEDHLTNNVVMETKNMIKEYQLPDHRENAKEWGWGEGESHIHFIMLFLSVVQYLKTSLRYWYVQYIYFEKK